MPTPTLWHVPYQRNPFFTGREDVLSKLHRTLHAENSVALSHPQGISGLGGIGKTQTALEYAYRYRTEYDAVFWVRADSITSLTSSLVELAHVLKLPERNEQDQNIIIKAVLCWFRLHTDWLLVYDNIDDLSIAEPFLPKEGIGHLLFTTRAHAFGEIAERLDIEKMEPDIGALLLLRRASLLALQATLNMARPDDQSIAYAISQELDGLPLALDQAGAYVRATSCSLRDYLTLYQVRRQNLLQERGNFNQDYPPSVATTWSLSFEKVQQAWPAAAELLNFCAFLAPDAIPQNIIIEGAPHLGDVLAPVVVDPIQLDLLYKEVLKYSLIQRQGDAGTLTIHRLVQAVLHDNMTSKAQKQWKQRVVQAVNAPCPDMEDVTQWDACERWLPHALVCATWVKQEDMTLPEAAHLLNEAGYYLYCRARYGEAEPLYRRALEIRERRLGKSHLDTATSLNDLAELYRVQGEYSNAEPLYRHALEIREKQLGNSHPDTATSLNNMAMLYMTQGKYEEAELVYRRALEIFEEQVGADHYSTANILSNLATLYMNQRKYEEAEPLYKQALEIYEKQLGADHPNTPHGLTNLATLYMAQGKYEEAEPLYRRALEIYEKQLGTDHHYMARCFNDLATLLRRLKKYEEAESLYRQALEIYEKQLGTDHPDTANILNNLARLYEAQGKYGEVEPLYRQALEIYEKQLGTDHPDTASILTNLARFYDERGRGKEAESLLKRVLTIRERTLGETHPETQEIQRWYSLLLRNLGHDEGVASLEVQGYEKLD